MSPDAMAGRHATGEDCEEVMSALEAYALGALDAEESVALESHLAACRACADELARYNHALAALDAAVAPIAPPPLLRERLLTAATDREPADPIRLPDETLPPRAASRVRFAPVRQWRDAPIVLPRVAAIGLALVASLLVVGLLVASVLVQQAQDELDAARAGQREIAEYLRNGGTVTPLVSMQGDAAPGEGRGSLVVAPGQAGGLLVVDGLAPSAANRSYRVWVARAGDRTRVDELRVGSDGTGWLALATAEPLASYDAVGITVVNPDTSERQDLLMAPIPGGAI